MEEIPPASPSAQTTASKPGAPEARTISKVMGYWSRSISVVLMGDCPRIVSHIIAALVLVLLFAGSMSGSRNPLGVRKMESIEMSVYLRNAIEQFHDDYGQLPLPVGRASAKEDLDTDSGTLPGLVNVLIGKEPAGTKLQNPRGTDYLEGVKPAKPNKKTTGPPSINGLTWNSAPSQYSVVDGWGNIFRVRLDTDGDGFVENPDVNEVAEGRTKLKRRVIVWSPGKDGKEETWTDNPKSWD
ncbi:MAG: hypothetical protein V4675_08310 [Verrucomicrobiota bacterium]